MTVKETRAVRMERIGKLYREAFGKIEKKEGWTKYTWARAADGREYGRGDVKNAVQFCSIGVLQSVKMTRSDRTTIVRALAKQAREWLKKNDQYIPPYESPTGEVMNFNDNARSTHEDIACVWRCVGKQNGWL